MLLEGDGLGSLASIPGSRLIQLFEVNSRGSGLMVINDPANIKLCAYVQIPVSKEEAIAANEVIAERDSIVLY